MTRKNRYFLMRHGESLANCADLIISRPETGIPGYGLSPRGVEQAEAAAAAAALPADTRIVCSDFRRAWDTAQAVARRLQLSLPIETDPRLRERFFGDWEGGPTLHYDTVWTEDDRNPEHGLWGVEPAAALAKRMAEVVGSLEERWENQTVLLVSHGDPLRFLQLQASGRPLTEHRRLRFFAPAEIRALDILYFL